MAEPSDDREALQALFAVALWLTLVFTVLTLGALWGVGIYHLVRWLI